MNFYRIFLIIIKNDDKFQKKKKQYLPYTSILQNRIFFIVTQKINNDRRDSKCSLNGNIKVFLEYGLKISIIYELFIINCYFFRLN